MSLYSEGHSLPVISSKAYACVFRLIFSKGLLELLVIAPYGKKKNQYDETKSEMRELFDEVMAHFIEKLDTHLRDITA